MYDRELYKHYKEHGICVSCGQEKAEPNRVRCFECLEKNAKRHKQNKSSSKDRSKALRQKRKAQGLCVWCGKPQCSNSTAFCIDCKIKNQRNNESRKQGIARSERASYGLCYRCGKDITSGKLCDSCKAQSIANLPSISIGWIAYHKKANDQIFRRECANV